MASAKLGGIEGLFALDVVRAAGEFGKGPRQAP